MVYTVSTYNKNGYRAFMNFLTEDVSGDYFERQCRMFDEFPPDYPTRVIWSADGYLITEKVFDGSMMSMSFDRDDWQIIIIGLLRLANEERHSEKSKEIVDSIFASFEKDKSW